jgi:sugar phosphate isomerase/epimerase
VITVGRRAAILGVAATSLTALSGGCNTISRETGERRYGLADITVMRELLQDFPGTLRQVAAMGYSVMGFRLAGYGGREPGEPTPAEKARMIRDAGLEVGVVRLGLRNVDYDRDLDQAVQTGASIVAMSTGAPFIAGPVMFRTTRAAFDAWIPELAAIAEKARARGLKLAYHNHEYDLFPLEGERPLDIMARQIAPELLSFEVDLAWTWYAGVAPLDLIAQLGPRVVSMHWKDIDRARGATRNDQAVAPGTGEMNYPVLLPAVLAATTATGYVEVDRPADGLAAARQGAEIIRMALRRAGG